MQLPFGGAVSYLLPMRSIVFSSLGLLYGNSMILRSGTGCERSAGRLPVQRRINRGSDSVVFRYAHLVAELLYKSDKISITNVFLK